MQLAWQAAASSPVRTLLNVSLHPHSPARTRFLYELAPPGLVKLMLRGVREERAPQWSVHETSEPRVGSWSAAAAPKLRGKVARLRERGYRRTPDQCKCKCKWQSLVDVHKVGLLLFLLVHVLHY